jgi:four helix bundle protein
MFTRRRLKLRWRSSRRRGLFRRKRRTRSRVRFGAARSVCANFAEAWRKRIYEAAFVSKINDAEGEAAETQSWIAFAVKCEYLAAEVGRDLYERCEEVIRMLVAMRCNAKEWVIRSPAN